MKRWSDEQVASYYASGRWTRHGLYALLAQRAAETPGKLAFHDGVESITYAELASRAAAIGAGLPEGRVVAVQMGNSIDHVVLAFAVDAAAAVLFELPPDATPPQVEEAMRRTDAVALFKDKANVTGPGPFRLPEADPDAVSLLIGTSGTTGTPKIAMRTGNGSLAMARSVLSRTGVGRDDVVLIAAPLAGGVGYINGLCSSAITGCTVILPRSFGVDGVLAMIEEHRVTALFTLPTLIVRMLAAPRVDTSSLRVVQTGGAYLHPQTAETLEAEFGCHVVSAYGAIDVGVPSMVAAFGDTAAHRHNTVGRPFEDVELALLDDAGWPVPDGEVGEVVMRGPSTALGYYEDEEATRVVYDDAGWGHFGDLGRIDEDGYLRIVGRLKEVINRGGKKISINEIEDHVRAFPGVVDVAAVAYADAELGERCCAVVVTAGRLVLTLEALRQFLDARGVAKHTWPERIEHLDELPMSAQGKVRRRELREMIDARAD
jgi:acyl-CoA synthetase (AMP-forming)/AMP-acid ligase II